MARKWRQLDPADGDRTLSQIVADKGTLSDAEILDVIGKLCSSDLLRRRADQGRGGVRPEGAGPGGAGSGGAGSSGAKPGGSGQEICIHPDNILVNSNGQVRFGDRHISGGSLDPYLPPELELSDRSEPAAQVYALGMLMLYLSTGQLRKKDEFTSSIRPSLYALISRCIAFDPGDRFKDTDALLKAVNRETSLARKAFRLLIAAAGTLLVLFLLWQVWQRGTLLGRASGETEGFTPGYSEGFAQGFSDAPGIDIKGATYDPTAGNLPGNYQAEIGAVAVADESAVYYISGQSVCRMDPFTEEVKVLAEIPGARCLQLYGGALYCCAEGRILRIDIDSGRESVVCEGPDGELSIFGDTFYLYDRDGTGYLYRVDPENGALTQLNGAMSYRCLQVVEGSLYYLSPDQGNCICRSAPDGSNEDVISSSSYEDLCICDGMIYASTGRELIRMDLSGGDPEILRRGSLHAVNVTDGGIYFLSGTAETLEWLSMDGKTQFTVIPSKTGSFNVAGNWIFYRNEDENGRLWRVRTSGTDMLPVTP